MIMAGKVLVDDQPVSKPGTPVDRNASIVLKENDNPYVSRGGLKLEEALKKYEMDVNGLVCMDVGASTGGFTDCLLQHGAACVYAVDVGYGQLDWKLRQDERITAIERTNIRYMPKEILPRPIDLVTIDVSFISLRIVVPAVLKFLKRKATILSLIKPQFEAGRSKIGKGGIIRDSSIHDEVIRDLSQFFSRSGLMTKPVIPSPIPGAKGNREFFISMIFEG